MLPEVIALKEDLAQNEPTQKSAEESGSTANTEFNMNTSNGAVKPNNNNNVPSKPTKPSKKQLENELRNKLSSLESEYAGKLDGLVAKAINEYKQTQSGKSSGSADALAKKYLRLGSNLEAECDARVYASIALTKNKLQKQNYSTAITEQAKSTYVQTKEARKKAFLNKVADRI